MDVLVLLFTLFDQSISLILFFIKVWCSKFSKVPFKTENFKGFGLNLISVNE